jgi:hypothetical protein
MDCINYLDKKRAIGVNFQKKRLVFRLMNFQKYLYGKDCHSILKALAHTETENPRKLRALAIKLMGVAR